MAAFARDVFFDVFFTFYFDRLSIPVSSSMVTFLFYLFSVFTFFFLDPSFEIK